MSRILGIAAALVLMMSASGRADVRLLKPAHGDRMSLVVGKAKRQYFRLASGDSTTVEVNGPGELKCIVRALPRTGGAEPMTYTVVVSENGHRVKKVHTKTVPTAAHWKGSQELASQSRSFKLVVPEGKRRLTVSFKSEDATAAGIRYVFRDASETLVPLSASGGRETVVLVVKEKPLDYYVADPSHPVESDVIGPTRLRVVSRLVFPNGARGNQSYTVKIEQDGKPLADRSLVTTKSDVVVCERHPDWILGKSQSFHIDVPKGRHRVALKPSGPDATGVALRLSLPSKDAGIAN